MQNAWAIRELRIICWLQRLKRTHHLKHVCVDWRILLKWMFKELVASM